jgi:hypothetical protein
MEPYESGANGRGRRIRRLPLGLAEGGGSARTQCRELQTEGGGFGRQLSDKANMLAGSGFSNAGPDMSAMRSMQGRSVYLTNLLLSDACGVPEKIRPCSRGEQGQSFEGGKPPARSDGGRGGRSVRGVPTGIGRQC